MVTRQARLLGRLAFIIAVLLIVVGAELITRHMDRTFAPVRARGSEWVTIANMPNLPEPPIEEYAVVIGPHPRLGVGDYDSWQADTAVPWHNRAAGILPSDQSQMIPATRFCWDEFTPVEAGAVMTQSHVQASCMMHEPYCEKDEAHNTIRNAQDAESSDANNAAEPSAQKVDKIADTAPTGRFDGHELTPAKAGAGVNSSPQEQPVSSPTLDEVPIEVQTTIGCVETILKEAVIEPYCVNGQIEGLRITGLETVSVAAEMPLKSGDIIRAINGQPLDSKRRALKIFKKARTLPTMMVEILRDGQATALLLDLRCVRRP